MCGGGPIQLLLMWLLAYAWRGGLWGITHEQILKIHIKIYSFLAIWIGPRSSCWAPIVDDKTKESVDVGYAIRCGPIGYEYLLYLAYSCIPCSEKRNTLYFPCIFSKSDPISDHSDFRQ